MANYYQNRKVLNVEGYEIYFTRFSDSILGNHFPEAVNELNEVLSNFYIYEPQIIEGGGGLSSITQELGGLLVKKGWIKENIKSENHVRGIITTSESHEIDHYKSYDKERSIGLEIEWNNKDPFFDRDLENFRKLHHIGGLSLGIIITRGDSLQKELIQVYYRFFESIFPFTIDNLNEHISLSDKAKKEIGELIKLEKNESITAISKLIYRSKYSSSTTHIDQLLTRIDRGVGNPCPCILIGIGKERLLETF